MRLKLKKRKNAYFTVEAVMVLPFAMLVTIIVMYLLLYQYDRCVMEQDAAVLTLWGSGVEAADDEGLEELVRYRLADDTDEKYVAWTRTKKEASLEKNEFVVKGGGFLDFPFCGFMGEDAWKMQAEYKAERLNEVEFIRLCNKMILAE